MPCLLLPLCAQAQRAYDYRDGKVAINPSPDAIIAANGKEVDKVALNAAINACYNQKKGVDIDFHRTPYVVCEPEPKAFHWQNSTTKVTPVYRSQHPELEKMKQYKTKIDPVMENRE